MGRLIVALLVVGLAVYAAIDCARTDADEVRVLPKPLWVLVALLVPVLGPLAWILFGRAPRPPGGRGGSRRIVAPDDDPDFLRRLRRDEGPPPAS